MKRNELLGELGRTRLVAVIRSKSAGEAVATATAAAAAGIRFVEITFSVPGALDVMKELSGQAGLYVGAGTVLSAEQGRKAIAAGAQFVVAPSLQLDLIPLCHEGETACFPGAATPTEIVTAVRAGADLVKIFPADCLGGVHFIRQVGAPFPETRFMVSGGVGLDNVADYVAAGVIGICLGSAYLAALLARQGREGFIREIARFVAAVEAASKPIMGNTQT